MAFQLMPMPLARKPAPFDHQEWVFEQYVDHLHEYGTALFRRVCEMDLEGIVAKHSYGPYVTEAQHTTWFKITNRNYSQMAGREELLERERHKEPTPGWHSCELACAEAAW
jgi:hypothetical protein